jgi:hypothetical protein
MKHKITDEIVMDITIQEWAKYFINTPPRQIKNIKSDSLASIKQKKILKNLEILNKTKPF